jgi:CrcB protein
MARRDARALRGGGGEGPMSQRILPYLLVGTGSFVGGVARFALARWVGGLIDARFPLGTFVINVGGSFVLGLIGGLLADRAVPHADAIRLGLGVGFCGGFTTFSTFEWETHALFEDGAWLPAVTNVFLSLFTGLLAVRFGIVAARSWF